MKGKLKKLSRDELGRDEIFLPGYRPHSAGEYVALVYPNNYDVGMSSLGFLTIYRLLIEAGFKPERFFFDIRDKFSCPISIESGMKLKAFGKIAFHFSYEPDYVNAVKMLLDSDINPYRNDDHVKIAGGSCVTVNPFPILDFFNAVFIGEIDLNDLSLVKNNSFFEDDDISEYGWITDESKIVKQKVSETWITSRSFSPIITTHTTFKQMNLCEISRGCPIRCKFCMTGNVYSDVRNKPSKHVIESALRHRENSNRVGLIAGAPLKHPEIEFIMNALIDEGMMPSLSSLNAMSLNPELLKLLNKSGMQTLTLGIESFNHDLQRNYGKIIPFEKLIEIVKSALETGFRDIRLYLMLGLPGASDDEEDEIIERITNLRLSIQNAKTQAGIILSINPFIPKVATAYSKCGFMGVDKFQAKIRKIKKELSIYGIKVKSESGKNSFLQYLLSLGDSKMSTIIEGKAKGKNLKTMLREEFDDLESYLHESVDKIDRLITRC